MVDDTSDLDVKARYSGDPWNPRNEYFAHAENHMEWSWENRIWPMISQCDFTAVIDLGAGHGRNSVKLRTLSEEILVLDIQPGNVEVMRERFAGDPAFGFAVNNGYDLAPAADEHYTLVYTFDAMVHFHADVVASYLKDTFRVLKPGGHGFFHHSNHTGGPDWRTNTQARAWMNQETFAGHACDAGLEVVRQKVIDWGGDPELDCLTVVRKPA
jgi:SAM-dependent methyltransferase